jgi:signal peptidase I
MRSRKRSVLRGLRDALLIGAAAVLGALLVKAFVFDAVHVPTPSMSGTLVPGDFVLVNKLVYGPRLYTGGSLLGVVLPEVRLPAIAPPRCGDIVLFRFPGTPEESRPLHYVKRLIGKPGDDVEIREGRVLVNGTVLRRIPTAEKLEHPPPDFGPYTVPRGMYFMLGDNLGDSYDSRSWGCVPAENIIGKALVVYWSKGEEGIQWDRLGTFVQ